VRRWFLSAFTIITVILVASCSGVSTVSLTTTPRGETSPTPNTPSPTDDYQMPVTAIEDLGITGYAPEVDIEEYRLIVDGLVESPLTLSYSDIMEYPAVSQFVYLVCPDAFVDYAEWTGVPMSTLLIKVGVKPEANQVTFTSLDGFERMLPIGDVLKDGVFLAYKVNGQVLPPEHGYPLRLVVKDKDGGNWIKWVDHIEVKYVEPWW
jgi:DMSO/TMAO reductase YedYZ molybdopterin-dependent catalytic subunit